MLLYPDDMKIYRIITSSQYNLLLQDGLNYFSNWCSLNNLFLNVEKCKIMSFSKIFNPILHDYYINLDYTRSIFSLQGSGNLY